jgi:hypothetical protein
LYNLRITYPNTDIQVFDDDVTGAFHQPKYNPNVISTKAYIIDKCLFVPTGSTLEIVPAHPVLNLLLMPEWYCPAKSLEEGSPCRNFQSTWTE